MTTVKLRCVIQGYFCPLVLTLQNFLTKKSLFVCGCCCILANILNCSDKIPHSVCTICQSIKIKIR